MDNAFFLEQNTAVSRFLNLTYKTLGSTGSVPLQRMEHAYTTMKNIIHQRIDTPAVDVVVLNYVCPRLPESIFQINHVIIGQSESFFEGNGIDIKSCVEVSAKARRRRYMVDGESTLLVFIASKSDLDDVIPSLIALQMEWNKCNILLQGEDLTHTTVDQLASLLQLEVSDMKKLRTLFGENLMDKMRIMQSQSCDFHVQNLEASFCRYRMETETWWNHIKEKVPEIETRPIYFVSSNTHSLINVMSGFAEHVEQEILHFAQRHEEFSDIATHYSSLKGLAKENLLYYLLGQYEADPLLGGNVLERRTTWEEETGILRISSRETLDVPTQIIDLRRLSASSSDERFTQAFSNSDALILNIDYPLGRTSYFILTKIAEHVQKILGIFVIGKAASLMANRGDVLIPSSISDQHTRNIYSFNNSIKTQDVTPFLDIQSNGIWDNQKAVTVLGTMLQNREMLDAFSIEGITDLEMEAGPYLAAVYEITHPKRYPEGKKIFLSSKNFDIGIIHYVSDNPLSQKKLDTGLRIHGVDATYACTRAVLAKVLEKESTSHA